MQNKKIVVMSFSGNVGKTIVAQHLLKPRIDNARVISVESINSLHKKDTEKFKGKRFSEIMEISDEHNNVIIDVGASNIEDFTNMMKVNIGSHEDFDYFVLPVINGTKQIADTISSIMALSVIGVEKNRILVLFNKINNDDVISVDFKELFSFTEKIATINPYAIIYDNELFNRLSDDNEHRSIADIVNDETDYRALINATDDRTERRKLSHALGTKRLALGVQFILDDAFSALFPTHRD